MPFAQKKQELFAVLLTLLLAMLNIVGVLLPGCYIFKEAYASFTSSYITPRFAQSFEGLWPLKSQELHPMNFIIFRLQNLAAHPPPRAYNFSS